MDIKNITSQFVLGQISAHELTSVAETFLQEGHESPSLIAMLTEDSPYSEDNKHLFKKALSEIEFPFPSKNEAAMTLACKIAGEIVSGKISPYEGSMSIWKEVIDFIDPIPDELWPFKSNASLIEDCITDTELSGSEHTELIRQAHKKIMGSARKLITMA
jgi:hypothetical protein